MNARPLADWFDDAACREVGWPLFMPDDGPGTQARAAAAYRLVRPICESCPVRTECLDYAMQAEGASHIGDRSGMWGGLTPTERYRLHLDRTHAAAA